ncbi:hypothetical protein DFS34DRAFT_658246 [Phlyctochytrium arcticum]|nr:hypothetical protein DFS34DRAFT_658246 [Phlyctochytrium arcticum]
MRNFIAHPFVEMDEFVAQYPRLYELKSLMVGHDESRYSVLYNDRMKRHLIFAICYEGQCMDRKTDYVKRYIGSVFIRGSHTDQRLLSRVNLGYHPSKSITRMNNMIMTAHERVVKDILENDPLLVVTIDDFHWCQVRPVPDAANAPGKFTSARTTANYAVKLHRELPPLPPAITDVLASVLQDTTWIPSVLCAPATQTYAELRNGEVLSKKMYAYSMATKAGSQEDFHIIGSDNNPMKSALDLEPVMDNIETFLAKVNYPDKDGSFSKSVVLAGDYYVWMYASKLLRSAKYSNLRPHVLPVPDNMHIALNIQEAVLVHGWTIIHRLWVAGYPDVENTAPINMRPKRRTAMLALSMTAWQECRKEVLRSCKAAASSSIKATPVRKAMVDSIISLFEDHIPLAVDCPYLLSSGDLEQIKMCLKRLFPLFTLLGKKNHVNIVLYQLGLLEKLPSHLPKDVAMAFLFSTFSSEDLEVFHSILRAAIRFQDTNAQVSRKAMLITAMRGESAIKQLAAMTERELALRGQPVLPIKVEPGTSGPARTPALSPLEKAADDVVPRMVAYLKDLFSTLSQFTFDVVGQHDKIPYASALPHYNLLLRPPAPAPPVTNPVLSSRSATTNKENTTVNLPPASAEEIPVVVLATIRESLLPLPLRRQPFVNLSNHIDVEGLQSVPMPVAKTPLADITNGPSPGKAKKVTVQDFLKSDSLKQDLTAAVA